MSRSKLYILLSIACLAGYIWIIVSFIDQHHTQKMMYEGCLIKQLTNIPCPSCGSTRAILSLLHGDVTRAFYWNPFGFIILGILFISPFWIIHDLIKRKQSLFLYFKEAEFFIRKKTLAIPLIMLVALNWFWNIYKGL